MVDKASKGGKEGWSPKSTPSTSTSACVDALLRRRHQRPSQKAIGTTDVRVDVNLNKHVWTHGIRSVPRRVHVRIARKRNDEEDAKEEFSSLVTIAEMPPEGLKGLGTKVIDEDDRINCPT